MCVNKYWKFPRFYVDTATVLTTIDLVIVFSSRHNRGEKPKERVLVGRFTFCRSSKAPIEFGSRVCTICGLPFRFSLRGRCEIEQISITHKISLNVVHKIHECEIERKSGRRKVNFLQELQRHQSSLVPVYAQLVVYLSVSHCGGGANSSK